MKTSFKVQTEHHSNPDGYHDYVKPMGFFATLIFIYIPTILFVFVCRAAMLYHGRAYVNLGIVDKYLLDYANAIMNWWAVNGGGV